MLRFSSFTVSMLTMPGGEKHIKCSDGHDLFPGTYLTGEQYAYCSFEGSDDLIALSIWADAVNRDGGFVKIGMPYLPGARQDRRQYGEALSAKVYADIINSMGASKVTCIDPHSDVMPALIYNLEIIPLPEIVKFAVHRIQHHPHEKPFTGVIAPDAGATKRAFSVAQALSLPCYQALKRRDSTSGKLSGFTCEPLPADGRYLVVDDICDAGGTFVGLAQATGLPKERLALWVTHGIFSGNEEQNAALDAAYGLIMTTNSHVLKSRPMSLNVIRDLYETMKGDE